MKGTDGAITSGERRVETFGSFDRLIEEYFV